MTDLDKSEISPHVKEFQIIHTTAVGKSEILPDLEELQTPHDRCEEIWNLICFCCKLCFVAIYAVLLRNQICAINALWRREKLSQKLCRWRKNDNYEVCVFTVFVLPVLEVLKTKWNKLKHAGNNHVRQYILKAK